MKPFMPKLGYFEPGTSPFEERIEAARKVAGAGYPISFIVAPIYMHEGWKEGYRELFERLYNALKDMKIPNLTFELIRHRYTKPAKKSFKSVFQIRSLKWMKRSGNINADDTVLGNMYIKKMMQKYWKEQ